MTFIDSHNTYESQTLTPQMRHFNAAALSERAVMHHRQAARLHDLGNHEQARIDAESARRHTVAALMACDLDADL
jgi:hypothetical protein